MKRTILYLLCSCMLTHLVAQQNVFLTIQPKFGSQNLDMNAQYSTQDGFSFQLDHFDYYLSGVQLTHDGGQVINLENEVFLIEPTSHTVYLGYLNVTNIEQLTAYVGVPSNLNTSSGADAIDITQYPGNHPLSFQEPSMHWGWTSGYMHMIIGGNVDLNADGTFETLFEVHSLGDANYRGFTMPIVQTQTSSNQIDINLNCFVDQWIKDISLQTVGVSHGTTGPNMEIMMNIETEPVFEQSLSAGSIHKPEKRGMLKLHRSDNEIIVQWEGIENANQLELVDLNGRILAASWISGSSGQVTIAHKNEGVCFLRVLDENKAVIHSIKCML